MDLNNNEPIAVYRNMVDQFLILIYMLYILSTIVSGIINAIPNNYIN